MFPSNVAFEVLRPLSSARARMKFHVADEASTRL